MQKLTEAKSTIGLIKQILSIIVSLNSTCYI